MTTSAGKPSKEKHAYDSDSSDGLDTSLGLGIKLAYPVLLPPAPTAATSMTRKMKARICEVRPRPRPLHGLPPVSPLSPVPPVPLKLPVSSKMPHTLRSPPVVRPPVGTNAKRRTLRDRIEGWWDLGLLEKRQTLHGGLTKHRYQNRQPLSDYLSSHRQPPLGIWGKPNMSLLRQLVSGSKIRSSEGCWTCRVRRKKCAENRPVCDTCRVLEITCYFQDEKPDWMDGGPKQREMGVRIKAQVKKQASSRRDRKYLEMLEAGTRSVNLDDNEPAHGPHGSQEPAEATPGMSGASDTDPSPRSLEMGSTPASTNTNGTSPREGPWHSQLFSRQADPDSTPDVDIHFLMIYLDYVFPYLFPHYRPPVLAGGRGWILDVIQSNRCVYHTAISLASAFFAIVLANGQEEHEECTARMVHNLESQLELGLKELQKEMRILNAGTAFDKQKGLVVMQSIIQMLFFEVATAKKDNWKMHLDAAIALFLQIVPRPEEWTETLNDLYTPKWPPPELGLRRPWSTNQAALRFFTATIMYIDVISSVTLGNAPRLYPYQPAVIPGCVTIPRGVEPVPAGPLFLEDFFGLSNYMVQALADVAALESWKRLQKQTGSLSVNELVSRGQVLSDAIKGGLQMLEAQAQAHEAAQPRFQLLVSDPITSDPQEHPTYQMIWLLATLSYLNVVISGWQPSNPEIRWSVAKATELLSQVPRGASLRALAWPFCLSGCLSPPEQQDAYRTMAQRLGPLQIFGTIKEAMEIMEKVWSIRGQIDESWDMCKCLNVLGHGVLLI
ncbi:hypothetical protein RJ55_04959 [Drechmeria coniospora]|nr:hypothetical protein RJ55_04959 [Drechmeria coniospora]